MGDEYIGLYDEEPVELPEAGEPFFFDDSCTIPLFTRPALLQHPNIPKGLAGINPRTMLGQEWWDVERRLAYERNNYCCWACGIHGTQDPFEPRLEAHEAYDFDYSSKKATFTETVALCHSCHNFIHCGRLWALYRQFIIPRQKLEYIIKSRLALLRENNLEPFFFALVLERMIEYNEIEDKAYREVLSAGVPPPPRTMANKRWQLIIPKPNGEEVVVSGRG